VTTGAVVSSFALIRTGTATHTDAAGTPSIGKVINIR
jgi:hypothetical protein